MQATGNAEINGAPVFFPLPGAYLAGSQANQPPPASQGGPSGSSQMIQPQVAHQDLRQRIDGLTQSDVGSFMRSAPSQTSDPAGYALWVHLVQLKTKALELEIAEAKRREREAEVELEKLRAGLGQTAQAVPAGLPAGNLGVAQTAQGSAVPAASNMLGFPEFSGYPMGKTTAQNVFPNPAPAPSADLKPFDFDAMLQDGDFSALLELMPGTMDPNSMHSSPPNQTYDVFDQSLFPPFDPSQPVFHEPDAVPESGEAEVDGIAKKRRASSIDSSASTPQVKKAKKSEKKSVLDQSLSCFTCGSALGRMMLRTPKSQTPDSVYAALQCFKCRPVQKPPVTLDDSLLGTSIGTLETRKRARPAVEQEDEGSPSTARLFCDVCQRVFASGDIASPTGEHLAGMAELVCGNCDHKYQRCTDCGGGGGPRLGIGKWRMKQLFQAGRKTCSLNHSRIGDRPREIAVHFTPTDFTEEQLSQISEKCKALWTEKTFARLAVPDMLEIDLPPQIVNPLRSFQDIESLVNRNWPTREEMIRADGVDRSQFVRILGLTWAHSKPRRSVKTVDLEGEWQRSADAEEGQDSSTVLPNVRRTSVAIPAGSELIGMWGGEWDMRSISTPLLLQYLAEELDGAILVSTFVPFEGTDGEDSTALSVGEMVTKVQLLQQSMNAERTAAAKKQGKEPDLLPTPEHLWTVSAGAIPLIRERMADILIRKRSFVRVDEYLTRHPDFVHAMEARPLGLHPTKFDLRTGQPESERLKPLILVRWLGKDFDAQRILEIKQKEFGGKAKLKKRPKARI